MSIYRILYVYVNIVVSNYYVEMTLLRECIRSQLSFLLEVSLYFHCANTFDIVRECCLILKKGNAVPDMMCIDASLAHSEKKKKTDYPYKASSTQCLQHGDTGLRVG